MALFDIRFADWTKPRRLEPFQDTVMMKCVETRQPSHLCSEVITRGRRGRRLVELRLNRKGRKRLAVWMMSTVACKHIPRMRACVHITRRMRRLVCTCYILVWPSPHGACAVRCMRMHTFTRACVYTVLYARTGAHSVCEFVLRARWGRFFDTQAHRHVT